MKYMLGIDQSTGATKSILFDEFARVVGRVDVAHKQYYPKPGWIEHDPLEIYGNLLESIWLVLKKTDVEPENVAAISITNQRETTILWDDSGRPARNAVVWQCARAEEIVRQDNIVKQSEYIKRETGMILSPYFSAGKAKWICDNVENNGRLLFGTMDSWLIWKLTGNHYTDYSNASRTQLFNINSLKWDEKLLSVFGLNDLRMPEAKCSDAIFGYTTVEGIFPKPIPVAGVMGDSHGALFAQQCWEKGMSKCTFGTGGSIMMNIGDKPLCSDKGIGTSIAWGLSGNIEYVFEGTVISLGDTIKWLANEMELIENDAQSQTFAEAVNSTEGVYLVPAFNGLGSPHWISDARAIICGMHRDTTKYHVVRAGVESIAYQIRDVVEAILEDSKMVTLPELRVDGGPTSNTFLMQFAADILQTKITVNCVEELSALGAVYAGGLAVGFWKSKNELRKLFRTSKKYMNNMRQKESNLLYGEWNAAVALLK